MSGDTCRRFRLIYVGGQNLGPRYGIIGSSFFRAPFSPFGLRVCSTKKFPYSAVPETKSSCGWYVDCLSFSRIMCQC